MDEGKDLRVRESFTQRLEHFLAAAHAGQPVVDEGNPKAAADRRPPVYDGRCRHATCP
jgi:hypothetical protein